MPLQIDKEKQILKMTIKIMERYKVLNSALATKIANQLYEYRIHLDKFQDKYYKGTFDLDEIILYLLQKQIRAEKTIAYDEKKFYKHYVEFSNKNISTNHTEKDSNKIITYKLRVKKRMHPTDFKYYYEETS